MFLSFGLLIDVALLVLCLYWCREMFPRWRRDLDEFCSTRNPTVRQVLAMQWCVTAAVVVLLLNFLVWILRNLAAL